MTRSLTQNDVLRYVYNETNDDTNTKIEKELYKNTKFTDDFIELSETKCLLDNCKYNASKHTLDNILSYSKSQLKESAQ